MLSTDSKVRVTLQISIKHSGSERVKDHMLRLSFKKGHALLKKKTQMVYFFKKIILAPLGLKTTVYP